MPFELLASTREMNIGAKEGVRRAELTVGGAFTVVVLLEADAVRWIYGAGEPDHGLLDAPPDALFQNSFHAVVSVILTAGDVTTLTSSM
jgi:hypothetical protein